MPEVPELRLMFTAQAGGLELHQTGCSPSSLFPKKWPQWVSFVRQASSDGSKTHWIYEASGMKVESDTEVTEVQEKKISRFRQTRGFLKSGQTSIENGAERERFRYHLDYGVRASVLLCRQGDGQLKMNKQFELAADESVSNLKKTLER